MKIALLLQDLVGLKQEDFQYRAAYVSREDGKVLRIFGEPLSEVLPKAKVCISGYLLSKFQFTDTSKLETRYGLSENQIGAIIDGNCTMVFEDGTTLDSPPLTATLEEVIQWINLLTNDQRWLRDEIVEIEGVEQYNL